MDARTLLEQFFPQRSAEEREHILWAKTGYPCFFQGREGQTPLDVLREQLELEADRQRCGQTTCYSCGEAFAAEFWAEFCADCE
jgi:hypothetical protein